jgi:hypothetical protein
MLKPLIVEVHIIPKAIFLEECKSEIIKTLENIEMSKYALLPLYLTSDVEDIELRICLQFEDPVKVEQFIVEKIRPIKGVLSTRVRLTLNGRIFKDGVSTLAKLEENQLSCHIFLKVSPEKDNSVWKVLEELKSENGVCPTWIFRDFYEYDRDITLRLIGPTLEAIHDYIKGKVCNIDGIESLNFKFMHNITTIAKKEKLLQLARNWFNV